jgi:uncharacterized membrane protein YkvA (DUF1232 family)
VGFEERGVEPTVGVPDLIPAIGYADDAVLVTR